ncbi:DUF2802 domain-containing protein [Chitinimonas taiwanensis]|uniref:DUF2802 domain-containing protein n=1 Tax=Chitinimonas taiwanensis TaxID=240412 RepID=UPI0035AE17E1
MNAWWQIGWQWWLGLLLSLSCVVLIAVLWRQLRMAAATNAQLLTRMDLFEDQLTALRRELAGLSDASQPQPEAAEPAETAYAQAIRLAKQGMDSSAVAAGCGISRGEAELIVALYRASQRP